MSLVVKPSACREDGRVILHDMREARRYSRAQSVLQHTAELTCVEYHPIMTDIFATSDSRGQVCLRDVRMAFGPASRRRDQGVVHQVRFSGMFVRDS